MGVNSINSGEIKLNDLSGVHFGKVLGDNENMYLIGALNIKRYRLK